jgi:hypothetical protein
MKIGVVFNCQHEGIAASLRALLPQAEVINFPATVLPEPAEVARAAVLNACDHLVITGMGPHHGRLSSEALLRTGRHVIMLPPFAFAGYHPDSCYVFSEGAIVPGVTGDYHSRLALLGFLAGLSVADTTELYHDLAFARLGYFSRFAEECVVLTERLAACGMDGPELVRRWTASGCFVHTINHPKIRVLLDYARFVCTRIGVVPRETDLAMVPDALAAGPAHPVFPGIAARLGIPPEGCFSTGADALGRHAGMQLTPFVAASFQRFSTIPEADLHAVDGVADGLAALRLPRRAARLRAATATPKARAGAAMALMTDHGTLLRQAGPSGPIGHLGFGVPPSDAPLLLADCRDGATAQPDAALAGAQLRPLPRSPFVTVWRDGAFLCAERDHPVANFSRPSAAQWERFLPLSLEEVAVLRRILATDWLDAATGEVVPRRLVHLGDSFILQFGRWRIDLARDFPVLTGAAVELVLDGERCVFHAAEPAPASVPPSALLTPGRRLVLAGPPCLLPPPVTMCDADRAWVYRSATDAAALNGRAQPAEGVVRREADQRVAPAGEGVLPGPAVRFCEATPVGPPWMDAAIRLHVLSLLAPAEAAFLVAPGTAGDAIAAWHELGFNQLPLRPIGADNAIAADLIWLETASTARLPAEALTPLRDRAGVRPGGTRRVVLPGAAGCGVAAAGFEAQAEPLSPQGQIALMAAAGWVIGREAEIPLAFCAPGARVIALSDDAAFNVEFWMLAAKLGLSYGVLPCQTRNDTLLVDTNKLASLLQVMAARL